MRRYKKLASTAFAVPANLGLCNPLVDGQQIVSVYMLFFWLNACISSSDSNVIPAICEREYSPVFSILIAKAIRSSARPSL